MTPFYATEETKASRSIYLDLEQRFRDTGGCTVIGGWAVYDLTHDTYDEQSRDVDLVLSTSQAFNLFRHEAMKDLHLEWAGTARRPVNACRFQDGHGPRGVVVDVFFQKGSDACLKTFRTQGGPLYKDLDCGSWLPRVEELLADKLATLPRRRNQDGGGKQFKDAIDCWALVFQNARGSLPRTLRDGVPAPIAAQVLGLIDEIRQYSEMHDGVYARQVDELQDWLES